MPTKIFNIYQFDDNTLLAVAIICSSTLVVGTFVFLLARLVDAVLVVRKRILKDNLKPALKEKSKVEKVQLHNSVKHRNKTIQESLMLIRGWLSLAGLPDLSVSADEFNQRSDANFSARIILELLTVNRPETLQLLVNFLNSDYKSSQMLSMALASLFVIDLDLPQKHRSAISTFLSDLFRWSSDSFLFDFVIMALTKFDQVGHTKNLPLPRVVSVPRDLNLYQDNFVFSKTPSIETSYNFFFKIPFVWFYYGNTMDDISLTLLEHTANDFIIESAIILEELTDILNKLPLPRNLMRHYDKTLADSGSEELKGDSDAYGNGEHVNDQRLFIEAIMIGHKKMSHLQTRMLATKIDIEQLFVKLDVLAKIQNNCHITCSPCILRNLEDVKVACKTLLNSYKDTKSRFVQFQRVFIIIELCDIHTILCKYLNIHLSHLSEAVKQRYISRPEIDELRVLTRKVVYFGRGLQKAFLESDKQSLGEKYSQQCEKQIFLVMSDCKTSAILNDKLKKIWESVLPIVLSVQLGFFELGNINMENEAEQAINHIQNEIFAVAYFNYTRQLDNYNINFLNNISGQDNIAPLFEKLANGIFEFARFELGKFKSGIHRTISLSMQQHTA